MVGPTGRVAGTASLIGESDPETGAGPGPNQPLTENPFQNLDNARSGHEVRTPQAGASVAQ